uniref:Uncharacterized protein n=1 Tax=Anopheles quadriannulatus TaxID=34691 RepID=A0A182XQ78_ANOQN
SVTRAPGTPCAICHPAQRKGVLAAETVLLRFWQHRLLTSPYLEGEVDGGVANIGRLFLLLFWSPLLSVARRYPDRRWRQSPATCQRAHSVPSINHQTRRNIVFFPSSSVGCLFSVRSFFTKFHDRAYLVLQQPKTRASLPICISTAWCCSTLCAMAQGARTFLSVFVRVASSFVCGVRDEVHTFFKFLLGLPPPVT